MILPLNIALPNTWTDITDLLFAAFNDAEVATFFIEEFKTLPLEIVIDRFANDIPDESKYNTGLKLQHDVTITDIYLNNDSKYYARATDTVATLKVKGRADLKANGQIQGIDVGSGLIDAFNRLRTSNPVTLFDAQLQYDDQPIFWDTKLTGTGTTTHDPDNSALDMTVIADGDKVERQLHEYIRYQAGKSQAIKMTYTPDENLTDLSVEFLLRSKVTGSVVDKVIPQAEWNYDRLDGTGRSGIVLDLTKSQIFFIDLEWLSTGTVAYAFVIDRKIIYCHFNHFANVGRGAYMTTANLPLKYEIERVGTQIIQSLGYNDRFNGACLRYKGTGNSATLKEICTEVESEGGVTEELGIPFSTGTRATPITLAAGASAFFAARPSLLYNGIENRAKFIPKLYRVGSTDEQLFVRVVYNPVITGGTWTPYSENGYLSIMELNTTITSISGGLTIDDDDVFASSPSNKSSPDRSRNELSSKLPFGIGIDADTPIPLVLEVTNIGTGSTSISVGIKWLEIR